MRVSIFRSDEDGEIGFIIKDKVTALMKLSIYDTKVAFTSTKIISTECTFFTGGQGTACTVCVHNLPLIYKLMKQLTSGMAEHFFSGTLLALGIRFRIIYERSETKGGKC